MDKIIMMKRIKRKDGNKNAQKTLQTADFLHIDADANTQLFCIFLADSGGGIGEFGAE